MCADARKSIKTVPAAAAGICLCDTCSCVLQHFCRKTATNLLDHVVCSSSAPLVTDECSRCSHRQPSSHVSCALWLSGPALLSDISSCMRSNNSIGLFMNVQTREEEDATLVIRLKEGDELSRSARRCFLLPIVTNCEGNGYARARVCWKRSRSMRMLHI